MSGELLLAAALSAPLVVAVAAVPLVRAWLEVRRLRDRYDLTAEEVEAYVRELPEICHAVADSLDGPHTAREIRRIASDSVIAAILRERGRRFALEPDHAGEEQGAGVTPDDLSHGPLQS